MSWIKREWTKREAEEWTKEDTITIIISPLIYFLFLVGIALSMLLIPAGFIFLGAGLILLVFMIYIIDPKLSVISSKYEKQQKKYIKELENKMKWEEENE
jgi:hypothetical protein